MIEPVINTQGIVLEWTRDERVKRPDEILDARGKMKKGVILSRR